jgi:hypothetical protein
MSTSSVLIKDIEDLYRVDIDFIASNLKNDANGFWARSFIKTVVSFYEAQVHTLKNELIEFCGENDIVIPPEALMFLKNTKYEIKDNGSIKEKFFQTTLKAEIKFIFNQICLLQSFELKYGYEDDRWSKLINTIEVRNRLTHPKNLLEQTVSEKEIENGVQSLMWFYDNTTHFIRQHTENLESEIEIYKEEYGDITK